MIITMIELEITEDPRGEWTRTISMRITETQYQQIKQKRIKLAPYVRALIDKLRQEESKGSQLWKKR